MDKDGTMDKKERSNLIDIMKALMILSVVVYHLIYRARSWMFDRIVREMIYLSMPLFILFAGYFFKDSDDSFFAGLAKRMKKLLLMPVITIAVLLLVLGPYYLLTYDDYTVETWLGDIPQTYLRPELTEKIAPSLTGGQLSLNLGPVWFIWMLAWDTVVFFIVMKFSGKSISRMIGTMIVLLIIGIVLFVNVSPLPWCLQLAPLYAGIMMIGHLLRKEEVLENLEDVNLVISSVNMIVAAVLHYFIFINFGSDLIYQSILGDKGYVSGIFFIIEVLLGGYVLFTLARLLKRCTPVVGGLTWIGRHTLVILLFHSVIGGIASDIMHTYNKIGPNWYVYPLTSTIIIKSLISFAVALVGSIGVGLLNDKLKVIYRNKKEDRRISDNVPV